MKKSILAILAVAVTFALTGCGGGEGTTPAFTGPIDTITGQPAKHTVVVYNVAVNNNMVGYAKVGDNIKIDWTVGKTSTLDFFTTTVYLAKGGAVNETGGTKLFERSGGTQGGFNPGKTDSVILKRTAEKTIDAGMYGIVDITSTYDSTAEIALPGQVSVFGGTTVFVKDLRLIVKTCLAENDTVTGLPICGTAIENLYL